MAIRTKAQIARDFKAWLEARLRIVDTGSGTVLSALILEGLATVMANANTALEGVQTAQGIGDPAAVDKSDLDDVAYNFSVTRKPASLAKGFITFRRTSVPASTIRIGSADGGGGLIVGTGRDASGAFVTFQTTETVFFLTTDTPDPVTGFYEVSAAIEALQPGAGGNKAAGDITTLVSSVTGVTSVTNKVATTGGKDEESNEELALRLGSRVLGLQPGIIEGLRSIALEQAGVEDATVVGPDDEEMQRSGIGDVDLVLKGSAETRGIDTATYTGPTQITLENRPVTDVLSVVSTVGLTQSALTEGAQWSFSQDQVGEQRDSEDSNDHISWLGANLPNANASVVITYTYDQLVKTVQDIIDAPDKHYPAADVLVKRATVVTVDITFTVKRTTTVDSTTLRNRISTALTNYIASLGLGETITQSALVAQIKNVEGVQQVTIPFTKLARRGSSGVDDIELTLYEYAQLDAQSLTITVTT